MIVANPGGLGEIRVFRMDRDGLPSTTATTTPSVGELPFGFGFDRRGRLLVTEAAPNAVSSYDFTNDGRPISSHRSKVSERTQAVKPLGK